MFFGGKSKIQPVRAVVRTERVADPKKPAPRPSAIRQQSRAENGRTKESPARASSSSARSSPGTPATDTTDPSRLHAPKSKPRKLSPARMQDRVDFGSDDDEDSEDSRTEFEEPSRKKQKLQRPVDLSRQLRQKQAFSQDDSGIFEMIHAADVSSSRPPTDNVTVELQYPSASQREKYNLVFGRDQIDPAEEIIDVAKIVTDYYLAPEQAKEFTEPNAGIIRQLEKAKNILKIDNKNTAKLANFKSAVNKYNTSIEELIKEGAITKTLDARHHVPPKMIRCMLRQVYDRAVSPKVDSLRQYTNGTDNVYGELLFDFISRALNEAGLKSDQVFVDFGSGVGNVVLQAALEFGCESWGCEMMKNAADLAEEQASEFKARCRLWGIQAGEVHLERGDFLENAAIHETMKRADVILVNNQAFTAPLNQSLVHKFLDLKDGCKIVSLRSFVPDDTIKDRNLYNPANLLSVKKGEYYSNSVSWTDAGGNWFLSTKDGKRLKKWADRQ